MLKLKDDQPRNLMGANKSRMLVCGRAKVPIFINNVLVTHEFLIVKNLICKVILGIDFLEKTEAQINVRDRIITFLMARYNYSYLGEEIIFKSHL